MVSGSGIGTRIIGDTLIIATIIPIGELVITGAGTIPITATATDIPIMAMAITTIITTTIITTAFRTIAAEEIPTIIERKPAEGPIMFRTEIPIVARRFRDA